MPFMRIPLHLIKNTVFTRRIPMLNRFIACVADLDIRSLHQHFFITETQFLGIGIHDIHKAVQIIQHLNLRCKVL